MLRAGMCAAGPEQMMADAAFAVAQEPAWSPYRDTALWLLAEAHRLAGRISEARALLDEASATAATMSSSGNLVLCESELAVLAMDRGEWGAAADRLGGALATIDESGMPDHVMSVLAFAAATRLSLHHCDVKQAGRQLDRAMRARPSATYVLPFVAVRLRLQLAKVCVAMADPVTARQLLREIDDILVRRPALGTLVDEVDEFRSVLAPRGAPGAPARPPLTAAELRVLPYLQTHLTVRGIAEQLFVSPETVKSEVSSIYRKLGVSTRGQAVHQAAAIGLLAA
jgi:LuxR family maltose regulon positive regulatory protein